MIISLRGPSGAGKSTLTRAVFQQYQRHKNSFVPGRKNAYYTVHGKPGLTNLVIPGHYEIANGGIDTLKTLNEGYNIARWADGIRFHALIEGKCMSDGVTHLTALIREGREVKVVHIDTSVDECIASVQQRGHSIAAESIIKTDRKVRHNIEALRTCDSKKLEIFSGPRTACLLRVQEWLGLS